MLLDSTVLVFAFIWIHTKAIRGVLVKVNRDIFICTCAPYAQINERCSVLHLQYRNSHNNTIMKLLLMNKYLHSTVLEWSLLCRFLGQITLFNEDIVFAATNNDESFLTNKIIELKIVRCTWLYYTSWLKSRKKSHWNMRMTHFT